MEFQHELVIPDEGLPFKFFLFEGSQGNYVREKHWHTSVEIFAVMEGSLTFYLNDEKHPLKAGELMIINSNEVHSIDSPEENHTVTAEPGMSLKSVLFIMMYCIFWSIIIALMRQGSRKYVTADVWMRLQESLPI